jgi:hypothetical protein
VKVYPVLLAEFIVRHIYHSAHVSAVFQLLQHVTDSAVSEFYFRWFMSLIFTLCIVPYLKFKTGGPEIERAKVLKLLFQFTIHTLFH